MKRFFTVISLSAALLLVFQFPASGQVRVLKNGHVRIGSCTGADLIGGSRVGAVGGTVIGGAENANTCDTISTLSIQGDGLSGSGGRIGFGHSADVFVSCENASLGKSPKLLLHGEGGFSIGNRESELIGYTGSESGSEGIARTKVKFTPAVSAPAYLTSSDLRLKTGIEDLEEMAAILGALRPVSYRLTAEGDAEGKEAVNRHYGFIAQEVREVLPEIVYEDEDGMLSLDYQSLIAVMAGCMQELAATVETQREAIASLEKRVDTDKGKDREPATVLAGCSLGQNVPNPFNATTTIPCTVAEGASTATVGIYDLTGHQKQALPVTGRGQTSVSVQANALQPGMYIYALIVDGQEVDSKRMIVTD